MQVLRFLNNKHTHTLEQPLNSRMNNVPLQQVVIYCLSLMGTRSDLCVSPLGHKGQQLNADWGVVERWGVQTDNVDSVVALLSPEGSLNGTIMACVSSPTTAAQQSRITSRLPPHHKVQVTDIRHVAMKWCHLGPRCDQWGRNVVTVDTKDISHHIKWTKAFANHMLMVLVDSTSQNIHFTKYVVAAACRNRFFAHWMTGGLYLVRHHYDSLLPVRSCPGRSVDAGISPFSPP